MYPAIASPFVGSLEMIQRPFTAEPIDQPGAMIEADTKCRVDTILLDSGQWFIDIQPGL